MPVKTDTPTAQPGPRYLNISGPFPFPGEPQADWDARYATIESETPLDHVAAWTWGDSTIAGQAEFDVGALFNITGVDQTGTQALFEALEVGDTVFVEQPTGTNTLTVGGVSVAAGVVTVSVSAQDPVGILNDGVATDVWITPK